MLYVVNVNGLRIHSQADSSVLALIAVLNAYQHGKIATILDGEMQLAVIVSRAEFGARCEVEGCMFCEGEKRNV